MIEAIRQNSDEEKRKAQLGELQAVIVGDVPAVFLYSPSYLYVSGKNIRGVATGTIAEPAERFRGAAKWYLRTARVLK